MSSWRLIPPLETYPRLKSRLKTPEGRAAYVAAFTALLAASGFGLWPETGAALAALAWLPRRRREILALAAILWILRDPPVNLYLLVRLPALGSAAEILPLWSVFAAVAAALAAFYLFARAARRFPDAPLLRSPLLALALAAAAGLALADPGRLSGLACFAAVAGSMVLCRYFWFFGYALSDQRSAGLAAAPDGLGVLRPFWGYTYVPFGKGTLYLERVEAKDADALAVARLKGLKLLLWSCVLQLAAAQLDRLDGIVPSYAAALAAQAAGHPAAWRMRWLALLVQFLRDAAQLSVLGHRIVAVARAAGYALPRNTYRPFSSASVAEYYNRYYYYFKELLADFFFYPTYLRFFKTRPRLRLFAATLAAAGLGNAVYHFLANADAVYARGLAASLRSFHVYAIYCLILGSAIAVSQLRARGRPAPTGARRGLAVLGVLSFYLLMATLADSAEMDPRLTIADYGLYLLNLFRP